MTLTEQLARIHRGCVDVITEAALKAKLSTGRQLIIKAGFDPTAPDLHLGHTVLLRKLRHFQDLGHKVIFLIGDATGLVGDPSGQTQTRRLLTWEDVRQNAKTYQEQVKGLLLTDPKVFEVRYNSEWFLGASPQMRQSGVERFDFSKFVPLASRATVARLMTRDDFSKRLKAGKPVSLLELFYPLMQGYDSVKIAEQHGACDVEIGGTDQTFNLLMGRELMSAYGFDPQVVLTMPLLEGTDGVHKMSKSQGNQIGISEPPDEMFGKLMSIPDPLIVKYFTLLTDRDSAQLAKHTNPRDTKADLATDLVSLYHTAEAAQRAREEFFKVFSRRTPPTDIPVLKITEKADGRVDMVSLLVGAKLAKSNNDARRLIRQGGVKLNGSPVASPLMALVQVSGATLQVGSRHFRKLVVSS